MDTVNNEKELWIVDCNPGPQDIITFLYLLSPNSTIEVKAITITHGKHDIDLAAKELSKLVSALGKDINIYKGSSDPLVQPKITVNTPKSEEIDYSSLSGGETIENQCIKEEHAAEAISKLATDYAGKINMLCLGPLTNLALAYHIDERLKEKLTKIVVSGGALHQSGNLSKSGEYNFASDAHAASLVLTAFGDKSFLVPLEISLKSVFDTEELEKITGENNKITRFLKNVSESKLKLKDSSIPTLAATTLAVNNSLITDKITTKCQVETQSKECLGQLLILWPINHYYPKTHAEELQKMNTVTVVKEIDLKKASTNVVENILSYKD